MHLDDSTQPALFASEQTMITIYGQPNCQPCRLARKQLDKEGIPYDYVDLTQRPDKLEQFKAQGLQATPIIETPTERFTGLQPNRIQQAAAELRQQQQEQHRQQSVTFENPGSEIN